MKLTEEERWSEIRPKSRKISSTFTLESTQDITAMNR